MEGTRDTSDPEVSVVLPALNEEGSIEICIRKIQEVFRDLDLRGEIIISDSSDDRTAYIARGLGVKVVHPKYRGYGCAYHEGFQHVRGKYVIIGDADNTYDFSEIPLFLAELEKGADMVIGSRFKGTIQEGAMKPLHKYIGNPLLTGILNSIFHTSFSDAHSGFRAFRTDVLKRLNLQSCGMEFASEMLIKASREHLNIVEVPVTYTPRDSPSKLQSFTDGWRHLRFILLNKPVAFLAVPGIFFSIFGLIMMAAFYTSDAGSAVHTHSFILGTLLLTGGLQLLLSGIIIRVYSVAHGYDRREGMIDAVLNYQILELFLIIGSVLVLTGLFIGGGILSRWVRSGYGSLNEISNAVLSLALVLMGLQIVFAIVFISMICLNQETQP
jgi:glycosyltransferase involved in cell wall biosynthesis